MLENLISMKSTVMFNLHKTVHVCNHHRYNHPQTEFTEVSNWLILSSSIQNGGKPETEIEFPRTPSPKTSPRSRPFFD